jgi:hypothetical protein
VIGLPSIGRARYALACRGQDFTLLAVVARIRGLGGYSVLPPGAVSLGQESRNSIHAFSGGGLTRAMNIPAIVTSSADDGPRCVAVSGR